MGWRSVGRQSATSTSRRRTGPGIKILGEPHFEHDFENVDDEADDFDLALGSRGLHTIRRRVEWIGGHVWRFEEANNRGVSIIRCGGLIDLSA